MEKNVNKGLKNKIGTMSYCMLRIEKIFFEESLKRYLKTEFQLENAKFSIKNTNYDDVNDVTVEFENKELNKKFFNEDTDDNGRLLLAEAVAYELNLESTKVSVYPDDSSEYILLEIPISTVIELQ